MNPLIEKLSHFTRLSAEDVRVLRALSADEKVFDAHVDVISEGAGPRSGFVLMDGMGCRYRILPDGKRQIVAFLLPGDLIGLHDFLLGVRDHSVATFVPSRFAAISREAVRDIILHHPRLDAALWWCVLQDGAVRRERIVSLGRRNAKGRIARLLCELVSRQRANGTAKDHAISLPLTQTELADTLGLTPVHVNRMVQALRKAQLIVVERRRLVILQYDELKALAGFDDAYLHVGDIPDETVRYLDALDREAGRSPPPLPPH